MGSFGTRCNDQAGHERECVIMGLLRKAGRECGRERETGNRRWRIGLQTEEQRRETEDLFMLKNWAGRTGSRRGRETELGTRGKWAKGQDGEG